MDGKIISLDMVNPIVSKIFKDEYISYSELKKILKDDNNPSKIFNPYIETKSIYLTFEGKLFLSNGGYVKERYRMLQSEKMNELNQKVLSYGSIGAAIGTIGLLLFEWLKYLSSIQFFIKFRI
ncbi:MAG: hypothetical protein A2X08_13470 [Bacteroidetes bacterium GWA2_32_17]|nr:MAG: hypothetical protein A2X08_13470 [Bacteroidetes bacterium GWA2_32_17]